MDLIFSDKQLEFIRDSNARYNLAHGSVRSGKSVGALYKYMKFVQDCPGNQHWIIGHSADTVYHNVVRSLLESPELGIFKHFVTWMPGKRLLKFGDKTIFTLGAADESSIGPIQGKTFDSCLCDEITLFPDNVIQMISTRLSNPWSRLYATMNPMQPSHIVKGWIDSAAGDPNFYEMSFKIEDNPFLTQAFKDTLKKTLSGLFYRRNYLGEWCLAEGAIFDFLDRKIHIVKRPPRSADFWLLGVDYGASNPFAAVLVGYSSGRYSGGGPHMWAEKEYFWDPKKTGRQKTNSEFARDLEEFIDGYSVRAIYLDPSAEAFQVELRKMDVHTIHANNDVYNGILTLTNVIKEGSLTICEGCSNLIREMEGYVWDPAKSKRGEDAPLKQNDHAVDALRYVAASFLKGKTTMRIETSEDIYRKQEEQLKREQWPQGHGFRSW